MRKVEYLSREIFEKGISTCEDKVISVSHWPTPKSKTNVRAFLGFCGYYHKFIKEYAYIAKDLTDLTGSKVHFFMDRRK